MSDATLSQTQILRKVFDGVDALRTTGDDGAGGGQATAGKQDIGNASLASVDTKLSSQATAAKQDVGNASVASIDTKLTSQATAANQATEIASLASIDTKTSLQATAAKQDVLAALLPSSIGQKSLAASLAVALPTDQQPVVQLPDGGSQAAIATPAALTQSFSGTGFGTYINVNGASTLSFHGVGTWNALIAVYGSNDGGTTNQNLPLYCFTDGSKQVFLQTDNSASMVNIGGWKQIVIRCVTYTSGAPILIKYWLGAGTGMNFVMSQLAATFKAQAHLFDGAGVAVNKGQALVATSLPVVLPSDYTLPAGTNAIGKLAANNAVDIGDVTINNASGASAVNVQDGGNSLTVDGSVAIGSALPAGTNAIGKLAANDGVDIGDVTVNNAQFKSSTGTIQAANSEILIDFTDFNAGSVLARVTNVDPGETLWIQFEGTINGTDWFYANGSDSTDFDGLLYSNPKQANGLYSFNVAGYKKFRIRVLQLLSTLVAVEVGASPATSVIATVSSYTYVKPAALATWVGGGKYNATPPVLSDGTEEKLQLDAAGNLKVSTSISAGAATIAKAEDAASANADVGVPAMAVQKATPANTAGTDGDYEMLQMSAGRLWASAKIDTALPAGTNAIGKLAANDGVDIGDVTINNASGASAVNIQDGGNSITVDGTVTASIAAAATTIAKAEDVGAADGDVGVPAMAVRKATPANTSGTDGDYEMLQMSAGRLWASATIDAALPAGANAIGKLAANDAVDIGDVTINNANGASAVNIQDGGNSITVDGTVTATIAAAAATIAKAEDAASANADVGTPSMAVRKATPANTSDTDGDYEMLQMSAGRLWASATIDAALPAGTNAIGKLAANSGVDIGDVDVTSIAAGTNRLGSVRLVDSADADLTSVKSTQTSRAVGVQALNDAGRSHISLYAVGAASGTTTTETAISLTKSAGTAGTSAANSWVVTSGKKFRITSIMVATRGHATATLQTTVFNFRVNTGGAVITSSTPVIMSLRCTTPATTLAWDRVMLTIPEGLEIAGDGTLQIGMTANATFVTNAPTWDVFITGYEY